MSAAIHRLTTDDTAMMKSLSAMFGVVFDDIATYSDKFPSTEYLEKLLGGESFIALVAVKGSVLVGGLAAYELTKFEQERSEIYIYDLAVLAEHRRQGIATELIEQLKVIGSERGAYEIFVQADTAAEDEPAIAMYSRLGVREDVLHFSIPVRGSNGVT